MSILQTYSLSINFLYLQALKLCCKKQINFIIHKLNKLFRKAISSLLLYNKDEIMQSISQRSVSKYTRIITNLASYICRDIFIIYASFNILRCPPLHLNLNPTILRFNKIVVLVDSSIAHSICEININISQQFLWMKAYPR